MLSRLPTASWLRRSWKPLVFGNQNFTHLPAAHKTEEETLPGYVVGRYYPTRIGNGDMSHSKYFFKSASMGSALDDELNIYTRISKATKHEGRTAVRSLLDRFNIQGPEDTHQCLVHVPLFENVWIFLHRNPIQRLPQIIVAFILYRVFMALGYLHTECKVMHTDIKADNIMFEIPDDGILIDFEEKELRDPCPRKEIEGRYIYTSREFVRPKGLGAPVLCDFGSAFVGGVEHLEDVQPNIYRAPEVIMEVPWTYSIDIWNAGCMIWDIFEGGSLFTGQDPELHTYRSRAHLAEMISLLGPPAPELVTLGQLRHKFLASDGNFTRQDIIRHGFSAGKGDDTGG